MSNVLRAKFGPDPNRLGYGQQLEAVLILVDVLFNIPVSRHSASHLIIPSSPLYQVTELSYPESREVTG